MKRPCDDCVGTGEVYHVLLDAVSTCTKCNGEGWVLQEDEDFEDDYSEEEIFIPFDETKHSLNQGDEDGD